MATLLHSSGRPGGIQKQLLTPDEAAEMLGLKRQTLAAWRSTRRYPLPYIRVGRSIRYRRADLEGYLETRTITPEDLD